jgi:hypothetical protein
MSRGSSGIASQTSSRLRKTLHTANPLRISQEDAFSLCPTLAFSRRHTLSRQALSRRSDCTPLGMVDTFRAVGIVSGGAVY